MYDLYSTLLASVSSSTCLNLQSIWILHNWQLTLCLWNKESWSAICKVLQSQSVVCRMLSGMPLSEALAKYLFLPWLHLLKSLRLSAMYYLRQCSSTLILLFIHMICTDEFQWSYLLPFTSTSAIYATFPLANSGENKSDNFINRYQGHDWLISTPPKVLAPKWLMLTISRIPPGCFIPVHTVNRCIIMYIQLVYACLIDGIRRWPCCQCLLH